MEDTFSLEKKHLKETTSFLAHRILFCSKHNVEPFSLQAFTLMTPFFQFMVYRSSKHYKQGTVFSTAYIRDLKRSLNPN